jgi:signal transduction histidine kinase
MLTTSAARGLVEADGLLLAYAAHELRGEIALQAALAEAALADPYANTAPLREMGETVVAACDRQQRLLEGLLTLARSEYGRLRREAVDLAATAADALQSLDRRGLTVEMTLGPAWTAGDPQLIERLVANLVANADRHNIGNGRIEAATYTAAGRAVLTIANTGPVLPDGELPRLFQPFQRLRSHADRSADGVGLGLAIVQAIANAHEANVTAHARAGGGLSIEIDFPAQA